MRRAGLMVLIVFLASSFCFAQEATEPNPDFWREHAELTLSQLPGHIKELDEPVIRILLRVRLAEFIFSQNDKGGASSIDPIPIIRDALQELRDRGDELPTGDSNFLRAGLLRLIRQRGPELVGRLAEDLEFLEADNRDQMHAAFLMLASEDGADKAVAVVRGILSRGQDPGTFLQTFLMRLESQKPSAMPEVLAATVTVEEQSPGTLSVPTLFWIAHYFLRPSIEPQLRLRFIGAVLRSLEGRQGRQSEEDALLAYRLIDRILPHLETLDAALYPRATHVSSSTRAQFSPQVIEQLEVERRIRESNDTLSQLIIEANAARDESLRNDLLGMAAQRAVQRGLASQAYDLASAISTKGEDGRRRRDYLLGDVAKLALREGDTALAGKAAGKMESVLDRVAALREIARHHLAGQDRAMASEVLFHAAGLLEGANNDSYKVGQFLHLAVAFDAVDPLVMPQMLQQAIKVINDLPFPDADAKPGSDARMTYARSLALVAYIVIPTFQRLVTRDEMGMYALANTVLKKEIKAAALFGASTGILQPSVSAHGARSR